MTGRLWYLTHPQVRIDPAMPVPDWPLNATGRARLEAWLAQADLSALAAVWSSDERKALDVAEAVAARSGLSVRVRPDMGENDRSATGFLPPDAFEAAADAFFAQPDLSFRGWETATAAADRIAAAARAALDASPPGDVLMCGHGAVGTLLWCRLAGVPIDRRHDQPGGGGHWWSAPRATLVPEGGWRRMEDWPARVARGQGAGSSRPGT